MSYVGPGGHLLECTVRLAEPLLHEQINTLKQGGQEANYCHLDVAAIPETTLADTVCKAHVVPRLVSRVGLGGKSFQTSLGFEGLLISRPPPG